MQVKHVNFMLYVENIFIIKYIVAEKSLSLHNKTCIDQNIGF